MAAKQPRKQAGKVPFKRLCSVPTLHAPHCMPPSLQCRRPAAPPAHRAAGPCTMQHCSAPCAAVLSSLQTLRDSKRQVLTSHVRVGGAGGACGRAAPHRNGGAALPGRVQSVYIAVQGDGVAQVEGGRVAAQARRRSRAAGAGREACQSGAGPPPNLAALCCAVLGTLHVRRWLHTHTTQAAPQRQCMGRYAPAGPAPRGVGVCESVECGDAAGVRPEQITILRTRTGGWAGNLQRVWAGACCVMRAAAGVSHADISQRQQLPLLRKAPGALPPPPRQAVSAPGQMRRGWRWSTPRMWQSRCQPWLQRCSLPRPP